MQKNRAPPDFYTRLTGLIFWKKRLRNLSRRFYRKRFAISGFTSASLKEKAFLKI